MKVGVYGVVGSEMLKLGTNEAYLGSNTASGTMSIRSAGVHLKVCMSVKGNTNT